MAEENKNSGEVYVAQQDDNISKIAEMISPDGGLFMTDTVTGGVSAVNLTNGSIVVG